ncbi:MAG: dTMP kinase [Desulfurococcaceae archaeon]|nr:dTMP kinase [Desulfurococcaceae archaeon]
MYYYSTRKNRGVFIVLEGIDGSGKTSVASMIINELSIKGFKTLYTFEPTDSEIVNLVKTKLGDLRDPYIDTLTFALDRLLHVKSKIIPALEQGYVVVCDRYYYSSVAYQGAQGAPIEWILEVNKWILKPDIAIYLDVEPAIAIKRKSGISSRFPEFEKLELQYKIREIYLKLVELGLLVLIDASRSLNDVYSDVRKLVFKTIIERESH